MTVVLVNRNKGFTLVELMVGMAISLIIMAGAVYVFTKVSEVSIQEVRAAKASQQARDVMSFMVRDLSRAGYAGIEWQLNNPSGANSTVNINSKKNCVTYSYNREDSVSGAVKYYGLRFDTANKEIEVPQSNSVSADCTSASGWEGITDPSVLAVNGLVFDCSNNCDDVNKRIDITLSASGASTSDESMSINLSETAMFMNKVSAAYASL